MWVCLWLLNCCSVAQLCPTRCDFKLCSTNLCFFSKTTVFWLLYQFSSVHFSHSVVSDSLWPHESQHARPPCPSPTPGVYSDSHRSSHWCHPAISSSVVPFSSCPQSLPAFESFPMSQLFTWGGQSMGVSALASFLPGEGNGNPLQYSCLENPMDGGAWLATVHGVAKSRTRLSDFTSLHFILICRVHHEKCWAGRSWNQDWGKKYL